MKPKKITALLLAALTLAAALPAAASQDDKKKQTEPAPQGKPVLWRDPGDVSQLDLWAGPGGEEMKPDLS